MVKQDKAYLVGTHRYSYHAGEPAEIIGVVMVESEYGEYKPCYHVKFSDGTEDYTCIYDYRNYKIISFQDILSGNIPKVTD